MATRKTTKKRPSKNTNSLSPETTNMLIGVGIISISLLVFFSTQSTTGQLPVLGQFLQQAGFALFGEDFRIIFSPILFVFGIFLVLKKSEWNVVKMLGILGFYISLTSLIGWYNPTNNAFFNIYQTLQVIIGTETAILFFVAILLLSLYSVFGISYTKIIQKVGTHTKEAWNTMRTTPEEAELIIEKSPQRRNNKATQIDVELEKIQEKKKGNSTEMAMGAKILNNLFTKEEKNIPEKELSAEEKIKKPSFLKADKNIPLVDTYGNTIERKNTHNDSSETPINRSHSALEQWEFPTLDLLHKPQRRNPISAEEIREKALIIQKTLLQFGIEVEMAKECVGPTVIQYRLRPAEGIRLAKIESLGKDLALALGAKSIRIQAPIPGMQLVGIEVPNDKRDIISIREVLADRSFAQHKAKLAIALGKDINGDYVVGDLAKMPHLLIAGQTGSGKSVGMNGLILSLLYKNSPADLQMIMVDPKQVELGMYDGIPHLLTPVITSPDKALNSLKWSVAEMERRFNIMREKRVKNLDEYNEKVEPKERMPAIVFIIDELADLMMSGNKKEVEHNIARIAQKGRAAGMHIIIATQRPSVNVITGIIKANIPTRIAFTVASQIDSRTILDQMGAESLLGRGDMLYFPTGAMGPTRVQGMLVDTDEIDNVVRQIRLTVLPNDWEPNIPDIGTIPSGGADLGKFAGGIGMPSGFDEDPQIIESAIELVQSAGKCSTSMLQRHLKLGYGRAARVVDILEEMGIVGPADGSKPREVLM